MNNTIIIIESPNKCEKIEKITGAKVYATKGHFKELSKEIVENYQDYTPIFEIKKEKKYQINQIFNECKGKDVIIATDPDREGYGIGYMVYEVIKNIAKSIKRAEFHEITESGIKKGLDRAVPFTNSNLKEFDSFKARAVGDKLVGFIMSPTYINKLNDKNISVGRVQTPALALIVKRELEIKEFNENPASKQISYKIKAKLQTRDGIEFDAINDNIFTSKEDANAKIAEFANAMAKVYQVDTKQSEIKPPAPFRTSQLQEMASKRLGFSSDKTMSLAQKLFEKGLITYHRTDSNTISDEFINEVEAKFKEQEWYEKKEYKAGAQSQAQAHEAIRISHVHEYTKIDEIGVKENLSDDEKALYELIFLNSIQSQAKNAINENTTYDISITTLSFKTKTSKCIYNGFKGALKEGTQDDEDTDEEGLEITLNLKQGDEVQITGYELAEVKKQAPKHYKESNFISLLEKEGIGRPSTYATFLPTLLKREYVITEKKGKNQIIVATSKGINFIENIKANDEWVSQSEFTKQMESVLDEISDGKVGYLDFIKPLHEKMGFVKLNSGETKPPSEKQLEWAKSIAKNINLELPKGIEGDWKICSNFIEKNKDKDVRPPSEKQLAFAKKLATDNKVELPNGIEKDVKICSNFIDKHIKKK
ncbi:DNA topoisomerase IA [Campylobacter pinnipediorum subsp. pinnipediorum]|uniref:DNA topoisomerase n=1 Tax=Campylobacter pinnipediorum subsp. pinnipediorum TaxID=1660067 RepID=A0AAX0LC55_9BACT|nr:type IA DNA topoisomerase [Campylobacter pinnipediorum]AQW80396.1 DNA topoisomerase IA [Campylobacter pinnipediorum subsp. pinnipediorum]OPA81969.1 DNA topoisomerase I [Campylobacter pinnipediorum subsp. pinnipediorum]